MPTRALALPHGPAAHTSAVYAVRGRPTGRGRPRGDLLHAVPGSDRTRSALCGARVGGEVRPWPDALLPGPSGPGTCPDCAALLISRAA